MKLFFLYLSIVLFCYTQEPITPIPEYIPYNKAKALLGKELFFDTSLSRDNSVACISCHDIYNSGGADKRVVSKGFHGKKGNIQSPTVLNAVFNFKQFWNGRAKDLYEQAEGPLNNPVEHNMTPELVKKRLEANPHYKKLFKKLYKDGISYKNAIDAIVEFEKALITPNSKFDLYLKGKGTLTKKELEGYTLFKHYGCISCHNGRNIGGNSFAKIGMFIPYNDQHNYPDRYALTHNPIDKNVFKVPTLRNISLTAPYFHDGTQKRLKDAIKVMGSYNLGVELTDKEAESIEAFLKTLTGKLPEMIYDR
ncbi:Cytochrome c551 peroxidase [hydrothermal vent metagenome]|uniref:Cytochrome c551 peroxidase n=1 Tax=hydrothermal vent metagenome TaxID=652676 RepID=A0A1W1BHL9_9ZZZZ